MTAKHTASVDGQQFHTSSFVLAGGICALTTSTISNAIIMLAIIICLITQTDPVHVNNKTGGV